MIYYNFRITPYGYGKTFYEMNKSWKELKKGIKHILDKEQSDKRTKLLEIKSIIEMYEQTYLKKKGE